MSNCAYAYGKYCLTRFNENGSPIFSPITYALVEDDYDILEVCSFESDKDPHANLRMAAEIARAINDSEHLTVRAWWEAHRADRKWEDHVWLHND